MIEHVQHTLALLGSFPAQAPDPNPIPLPGKLGDFSNTVIGWLKTIAIIFGVGMLVVSGIMVIVGRRNRHTTAMEGLTGTGWVIAGLAIVGASATIVGAIPT